MAGYSADEYVVMAERVMGLATSESEESYVDDLVVAAQAYATLAVQARLADLIAVLTGGKAVA